MLIIKKFRQFKRFYNLIVIFERLSSSHVYEICNNNFQGFVYGTHSDKKKPY